MLASANDTMGYSVLSRDKEDVGKIDDFLFEDTTSKVRYLVINVGGWIFDRSVLLSPAAFGELRPEGQRIETALVRTQIEDSPPIDADQPVSRQQETALHGHYGWTPYWDEPVAAGLAAPYWGAIPARPLATPPTEEEAAIRHRQEAGDPHLRSAAEVIGYYVGASDGDIGHVEDLLFSQDDWTIRYLVIDTRNWLPGRKVLVATDWLQSVDWHEQKIGVNLDRERIKSSPEYDPTRTLDRDYQQKLYEHYDQTAGWF